MAAIETIEPVVRICAVISQDPDAIQWGVSELEKQWGKVCLLYTSPSPRD